MSKRQTFRYTIECKAVGPADKPMYHAWVLGSAEIYAKSADRETAIEECRKLGKEYGYRF